PCHYGHDPGPAGGGPRDRGVPGGAQSGRRPACAPWARRGVVPRFYPAPAGPRPALPGHGVGQVSRRHGALTPVIRLPATCLVVLIGPSGAGKSTWAATNFRPGQVVASDDLRAMIGEGPHDQRASKDAFELLDVIIERRLRRKLLT